MGAVGDKMGRAHGIDMGRVDISGDPSPALEEAPQTIPADLSPTAGLTAPLQKGDPADPTALSQPVPMG